MNIILEGRHGSGKRAEALRRSAEILKADPAASPFFKMIEPNEKGNLTVDRIGEISDFCRFAGEKVVVVTNLHLGTKKFQQSLLKILEDTVDGNFILTTEGELLDTIYSRCCRSRVKLASEESVKEQIINEYSSLNEKAWRISGNRKSIYDTIIDDKKYLDTAWRILEELKNEEPKELFKLMGAMPDGVDTFYQTFGKGFTELLLDAMTKELIVNQRTFAVAYFIETEKENLIKFYNKGLWFSFVKRIYELMS